MTDEQTPEPTYADATPPEDFEPARTLADGPFGDEPADEVRTLSEWPADVIDSVRAAEAAAQRSVCNVPDGDLPDELAQALELRVEVNLAQHDGKEIRRVGSTDPEVRRLEAPFSKRRAPERDDAPTDGGRRQRRSTSKKTQSRKD